jgi:DNA-binding LacI/PurR family transcriptional regulator
MTPPNGRPRVTLADVARLARVDPSVVSRVINSDGRLVIKHETRERVLAAIRELNYHPNAAARSLRTAQSGAFGLLIPDFANPIYAEIIKGAEEAAGDLSSLLLTATARLDRAERYVEMLVSGRVDGLLLAAGNLERSTIAAIAASGRPVVSVNQRISGISRAILADDERASRLAVDHLRELGHVSIAHLRGPVGSDTAKRRLSGYRRAMRLASLEPGPVVGQGYTVDTGAAAMRELLDLDERPTAVVVANVAAAVGALSAAVHAGLRLPDDLSVVAIHDIPLADNLVPALTTVRMPLAQMGAAGVAALVDSTRADEGVVVVRNPTELIVRESTAPPGGAPRRARRGPVGAARTRNQP